MELSPSDKRRVEMCLELEAVLATESAEAAEGLGEYLSPALEPGEALPDLCSPLGLYQRKMASSRTALCAAVKRWAEVRERIAELCGVRDDLAGSVARRVMGMRRTCKHQYCCGEEGIAQLGLAGHTARGASRVLRQGVEIVQHLEQPNLSIESPDWPELRTWLTSQVELLRLGLRELGAKLEEIGRLRRESKSLSKRKKEALDELDRDYTLIARTADAAFRMAGKADAAQRIPSPRLLDRKSMAAGD